MMDICKGINWKEIFSVLITVVSYYKLITLTTENCFREAFLNSKKGFEHKKKIWKKFK